MGRIFSATAKKTEKKNARRVLKSFLIGISRFIRTQIVRLSDKNVAPRENNRRVTVGHVVLKKYRTGVKVKVDFYSSVLFPSAYYSVPIESYTYHTVYRPFYRRFYLTNPFFFFLFFLFALNFISPFLYFCVLF